MESEQRYEHRRTRLEELIGVACGGKHAAFAAQIGRDPSYVSRMLYAAEKKGRKRISDGMVAVIEDRFNLPRAWLDMPLGTALPGRYKVALRSAATRVTAEEAAPNDFSAPWPFSTSRERFDQLPAAARERVDAYLAGAIATWEVVEKQSLGAHV